MLPTSIGFQIFASESIRHTNMARESERESPCLDMNHGFMYSIIRNQVDRDEYDKEQMLVKLEKEREIMDTSVKEERKLYFWLYALTLLMLKSSSLGLVIS